jgi:sugar lactone lactonase YvrE
VTATASYGGLFTAGGAIKATTLRGRLGSITSNSLTLSVQDATVSITPATGSLGPAGESDYVKFAAVNTFSDGSTNSQVTFSSSNSRLVAINSTTGTAVPGDDAPNSYGTVEIKATLKGDARRLATASAAVANYEVSTFAGSLQGADGTGTGARFSGPNGIVLDGDGNVYVADTGNRKIRKITPQGVVTTLAGSGSRGSADGTGTAAQFVVPYDLAMAGQSPILPVSDLTGVRKIYAQTAEVTTVPYPTPAPYIVETDPPTVPSLAARGSDGPPDPYLAYAVPSFGSAILKAGVQLAGNFMYGDQLGDATTALFRRPLGLARGLGSSLLIADEGNHKIKKLESGTVSLVAGSTQGYFNGPDSVAKFSNPRGLTVDGAGNVFVADAGNHRIRKIDTGGSVTSVAGSSEGYADGAVGSARFKSPSRVAVAADGPLSEARGLRVQSVAVDPGGNLFFSEDGELASKGTFFGIRKINRSDVVSTIMGGKEGLADGIGPGALFSSPRGLAFSPAGDLYVADKGNNLIRKIRKAP